jgi:hypothetical protein
VRQTHSKSDEMVDLAVKSKQAVQKLRFENDQLASHLYKANQKLQDLTTSNIKPKFETI